MEMARLTPPKHSGNAGSANRVEPTLNSTKHILMKSPSAAARPLWRESFTHMTWRLHMFVTRLIGTRDQTRTFWPSWRRMASWWNQGRSNIVTPFAGALIRLLSIRLFLLGLSRSHSLFLSTCLCVLSVYVLSTRQSSLGLSGSLSLSVLLPFGYTHCLHCCFVMVCQGLSRCLSLLSVSVCLSLFVCLCLCLSVCPWFVETCLCGLPRSVCDKPRSVCDKTRSVCDKECLWQDKECLWQDSSTRGGTRPVHFHMRRHQTSAPAHVQAMYDKFCIS